MKTNKLSAITIRRLRRVREAILKEPEMFNQDCPRVDRSCGTAGCILGWANALFPGPVPERLRSSVYYQALDNGWWSNGTMILAEAAARLRLDFDQAVRLWESNRWPWEFGYLERLASEPSRARAWNAAKRITHFIKTGGEE